MPLSVEVEQELDGRWLAEVPDLPGVLGYGQTRQEAIDRVQALSLRVLAEVPPPPGPGSSGCAGPM